MTTSSALVYDSADGRPTAISTLRELTTSRAVLGVLLRRDLVLRHKRSALGVLWSLLNPLLMGAAFWLVFSNVFDTRTDGVPYVVYVLSGIVLITMFTTAALSASTALVSDAPVLARIRAPAAAFAIAGAGAAIVTSIMGVAVLLGVQLVTGTGIAVGFPLVLLPMLSLLLLAAGIGLALAPLSVRFHDVLELLRMALQAIMFLTPTFYPLSIVPERYRWVLEVNPLTHYLEVFRQSLYGGPADLTSWLVVAVVGPAAMFMGLALFARGWPRIAPWL